MVDLKLLEKQFNTSNAVLRKVFTHTKPNNFNELEEEEQKAIKKDCESATRIEGVIRDRLQEGMTYNLKNYQVFMAVDLAWDSSIITKKVIPLTLFAQGKMPMKECASALCNAGYSQYVTKNEQGYPVSVDLPKFYECQINLIRSIMTRRLAAQSNKYANLWPYYRYEPRGTSTIDKLKSDLVSQRMDIMSDHFDHRHHDVQIIRDMLMYTNVYDFVRCAWEQEKQVRRVKMPPGLEQPEGSEKVETKVVKEGIAFINPHPSRVFWDRCYPAPSLNSDTGCEWVGYWDVQRWKDVNNNLAYWNRERVGYSGDTDQMFATYSQYFSNYYCTVTPPCMSTPGSLSWSNDRKSMLGYYTGLQGDSSVVVANFFWKLKPSEWGLGDYPYDVWVRFVVAGDNTVVYAEYLPSSPCTVTSHNANDARLVNISFAHELMAYQDQMTNLFNHLLLCLIADHIKVMIVDKDFAEPEHLKAFRQQIKASAEHPGTMVLEISRSKAEALGLAKPEQVVTLVETRSAVLGDIFNAITALMQMVERMAALSPQEQGQPAPREISATETNLIAGTTESVYGFISDSIDETRAARKRILFESWMVMGEQTFKLPVADRYPKSVIEAAGLRAEEGTFDPGANGEVALYTVTGNINTLEHDIIFTSRDGAERAVNTQSATVLVQLLSQLMSMPQLADAVSKEQLYEMMNEVFRQSGAGVDLKMELQHGDSNQLGESPDMMKQLESVIQGLVQSAENQKVEIEQIKGVLMGGAGGAPGGPPPPGMQAMPPPEAMPPEMAAMGPPPQMAA